MSALCALQIGIIVRMESNDNNNNVKSPVIKNPIHNLPKRNKTVTAGIPVRKKDRTVAVTPPSNTNKVSLASHTKNVPVPLNNPTVTSIKSTNVSTEAQRLRFDVLARQHGPSPKFPSDFNIKGTVIDVLRHSEFNTSSLKPLNLTLNTNMLGILIDAGRHYFSIDWLKRLVDVLAALQYNLIHLRLTDDQAFAIQLESQPALAYPTNLNGNTKVYSREEMKDLIAYARNQNINIVPEINVPGHAGAWAGIPGLVVPCKKQACRKGYALPLNISHPDFRTILTDVLREVVDIFENPPYLHLGGDEMEMAKPCFDEVGAKMFNYSIFETMLKEILNDIQYPEEQVIRWRETSFAGKGDNVRVPRAGTINHWWHDTPGKTENVTVGTPIIGSARLYMDVNENEAAWEVFLHSRKWWHLDDVFAQNAPVNLKGIIIGAFELGEELFFDRNVVGRLLAVLIGVSNIEVQNGNEVNEAYGQLCHQVGFPESLCHAYGHPLLDPRDYRSKWGKMWVAWKMDTCNRF